LFTTDELIDDLRETRQLQAVCNPASSVLRWVRQDQHLVDRVAINPKTPSCGTAAHAVNNHSMAKLVIKLHSLHPAPPLKGEGLARLAPFYYQFSQ